MDGNPLEDRRAIARCGPLDAGEHTLELMARGAEQPVLLHRVSVQVREMSEGQHAYDEILARYLAWKEEPRGPIPEYRG